MLAKNLSNGFSSLYAEVTIRAKSLFCFLGYPLKDFSLSLSTIVNNDWMFRLHIVNLNLGTFDRSLFAIDYDKLPCTKSLSVDLLFMTFGGAIPPSKEQISEWDISAKRRQKEDEECLRNLITAKDKEIFEIWLAEKKGKTGEARVFCPEKEQNPKEGTGCPFDEELPPLVSESSNIQIDSRSGKIFDAEKEQNKRRSQGCRLSTHQ